MDTLLARVRAPVIAVACLALSAGCRQLPKGVTAVRDFDAKRYLGTWYEIARLDHPFERGLTNVTATYSRNADGTIAVLNRGYDAAKGTWQEASAVARWAGDPAVASLKVYFFGPFGGPYNVIELDRESYTYALVCSGSRDYLWILCRTPAMPAETKQRLIQKAAALGFDTDALIMVAHDRADTQ